MNSSNNSEMIVNNVRLTGAQSMTVMVALNHFLMSLEDDEADSDIGPIGEIYKDRITEVLNIMVYDD